MNYFLPQYAFALTDVAIVGNALSLVIKSILREDELHSNNVFITDCYRPALCEFINKLKHVNYTFSLFLFVCVKILC